MFYALFLELLVGNAKKNISCTNLQAEQYLHHNEVNTRVLILLTPHVSLERQDTIKSFDGDLSFQ